MKGSNILAIKLCMKVCNPLFITYSNAILTIMRWPAKHFFIHHLIGSKILPLLNIFVAVEKYIRYYPWLSVCLLMSCMFSKKQTCSESFGLIKTNTAS